MRVMEALDESFFTGEPFSGDPFKGEAPDTAVPLMLSIAVFLVQPASTYSPSLVQRSGEL